MPVVDPPPRPPLGFARPGSLEPAVRPHPSRRRVAAILGIALMAGACSRPLDVDGLERELAAQLQKEFDTPNITVTCPDDVKAEAGSTFECEASDPSGATVVITVTQKDDQGHVTWKVTNVPT